MSATSFITDDFCRSYFMQLIHSRKSEVVENRFAVSAWILEELAEGLTEIRRQAFNHANGVLGVEQVIALQQRHLVYCPDPEVYHAVTSALGEELSYDVYNKPRFPGLRAAE